jgi:predicted ATPase
LLYERKSDKNKALILKKDENTYINIDDQNFKNSLSVLSQIKEPRLYPEIFLLSLALSNIWFYRTWYFGRYSAARLPQKPDLPNNFLMEDISNLSLVINRLRKDSKIKKQLIEALSILYPGINDLSIFIDAGSVQLYFDENGNTIPATRLSDGTLRYLCLLAILLNPDPAPLICIEEPEIGLHPDVLHSLADLLKKTSERTQLLITTHSEILVDALTDTPESIIVCEKENGSTVMRRLEKEKLDKWLKEYSLGHLWTTGELGGTRW